MSITIITLAYVCMYINLCCNSSYDQNALLQLQSQLSNSPPIVIQVRRSDILKDALKEAKKKTFAPEKRIKVCNHAGQPQNLSENLRFPIVTYFMFCYAYRLSSLTKVV